MTITVLNDLLISKIAAGEVIERPASIVKEAIENAIDARATKIHIELKEGGKEYIKIKDNGIGMNEQDLMLCWRRHTTSKITSDQDLFSINTLGFRGEALASIGAISTLIITSQTINDELGNKIEVQHGELISKQKIASTPGTTLEVHHLFASTPVRKKYLKSTLSEFKACVHLVEQYALIHPKIAFKVIHQGKLVLSTHAAAHQEIIAQVLGNQVSEYLVPIEEIKDTLAIQGFIAKPSLHFSTRSHQYLYINKRAVSLPSITKAIESAYDTMMMVNRYPLFILNIQIDPAEIDVNVHPQKTTIRLKNEHQVFEFIYASIVEILQSLHVVPQKKADEIKSLNRYIPDYHQAYNLTPKQQLLREQPHELKGVIMGILNKTYIVMEIPGQLVLVDQHAAAERILYEQFKQQLLHERVAAQSLLEPIIIDVSSSIATAFSIHQDKINMIGYDADMFGDDSIRVRSIPQLLSGFGPQFIVDLINEFEDDATSKTLQDVVHKKMATKACRSAIKAGDEITLPQIKQYILDLSKTNNPNTCPHGRPIMVALTLYEIEKMFKRVV